MRPFSVFSTNCVFLSENKIYCLDLFPAEKCPPLLGFLLLLALTDRTSAIYYFRISDPYRQGSRYFDYYFWCPFDFLLIILACSGPTLAVPSAIFEGEPSGEFGFLLGRNLFGRALFASVPPPFLDIQDGLQGLIGLPRLSGPAPVDEIIRCRAWLNFLHNRFNKFLGLAINCWRLTRCLQLLETFRPGRFWSLYRAVPAAVR